MTDGVEPLATRVTVVEWRQAALERRFDEHLVNEKLAIEAQGKVNDALRALVTKLDERADRQDVLYARLLGGVAVLVTVGQILAPLVLRALGL